MEELLDVGQWSLRSPLTSQRHKDGVVGVLSGGVEIIFTEGDARLEDHGCSEVHHKSPSPGRQPGSRQAGSPGQAGQQQAGRSQEAGRPAEVVSSREAGRPAEVVSSREAGRSAEVVSSREAGRQAGRQSHQSGFSGQAGSQASGHQWRQRVLGLIWLDLAVVVLEDLRVCGEKPPRTRI